MTTEIVRDGNTVEFEIEIAADQIEKAMQAVYQKEKHNFQLAGFRKGRVPRQILELNFGNDLFFEDAINNILPDAIQEAVDKNHIRIAGHPSVDLKDYFEKGKALTVKVTMDVMPEFEVDNYKAIKVDKINYEVSDQALDKQLEAEQRQNGRTYVVEDRSIAEGDIALIDFTGFLDGEEFEGGHGEDYELTIGSGQFIPGFEEKLIGAFTGDEVELDLTFPENYHAEELAGKDVVFDVFVKEIRQVEYPDIDDDFIKDISEFDTVEEYKDNAKKELEEQFANRSEAELRQRILEKVASLVDFDLPTALVEQQIDQEMKHFFQQLSSQGIDVSQFMSKDMDTMRESFRGQAEISLRTQLTLEQIAKQENIEVSEEELENELDRLSELYIPYDGQEEERQNFKDRLRAESLDFVKSDLKEKKTIDLLVENAELREISEEEYKAEIQAKAQEQEEKVDED